MCLPMILPPGAHALCNALPLSRSGTCDLLLINRVWQRLSFVRASYFCLASKVPWLSLLLALLKQVPMVGKPIWQEQSVASSQQSERNWGPWSNSPQGTGILPVTAWKAVDLPTAEPSGETPALASPLVTSYKRPWSQGPSETPEPGKGVSFSAAKLWQFINQK